ncbi:hypothetical protein CFOL_v3_24937 [Cephalotus follicularis]|uniref:Uncharacterized protein n=1 Tax=Cephalotus follicularis TaxID=3775 RepID=A0A1Q3CMY9_CEPFO|nr:hypothetical protein CFOL_v3_24937 [Cephalotus follicularis]
MVFVHRCVSRRFQEPCPQGEILEDILVLMFIKFSLYACLYTRLIDQDVNIFSSRALFNKATLSKTKNNICILLTIPQTRKGNPSSAYNRTPSAIGCKMYVL